MRWSRRKPERSSPPDDLMCLLETTVRGYPFKLYGEGRVSFESGPDYLIIDGGWVTDEELARGWMVLPPQS